MTSQADHIVSLALNLPANERVFVMQCLLESLKAVEETARDERPWETPEFFEEMQRRMDDFDAGKDNGIPADEAFAKMRAITG